MNQAPYKNTLCIGSQYKGIPYGPADREDGNRNHGFKLLKGYLDLIGDIPELIADPDLRDLVSKINSESTGLLTIGCLSHVIHDQNGHRNTGYVEFSFNSKSLIACASNYFPIFFHFSQALHANNFPHQMNFDWELSPATFIDSESSGFTCCIYLNSWYKTDQATSQDIWSDSLYVLGEYLSCVPQDRNDYLYHG